MLALNLKRRFPSLARLGLAIEYFPRYVHRTIQLHSLDVVLLTFVRRGRGRHLIDREVFDERGASLAVTNYGQRHDLLTDARGMEVINVYLDLQNFPLPVLPRELQPVLPLLLPLQARFLHRLNRIVRLQFDQADPFAAPLFSILREFDQREDGYEEAVFLQFKWFLILCCRQAKKNGFLTQRVGLSPQMERMEEVRQYLDTAFAKPLTLQALAQRAGLSRTYLCRAFKAYTGKRLFDYLIERRIQSAMVRLRCGDEKVLSIALDCGFNDLAYFNRKFKELLGQSPSAYRAIDQRPHTG